MAWSAPTKLRPFFRAGHIGSYLVPRLVALGHEVTSISRGRQVAYQGQSAWGGGRQVTLDREAEEAAGAFGRKVRELAGEVIIDLICYVPDSARQLVEAVRGHVQQFLHAGSIWVHGHGVEAPVCEDQPRRPLEDYGKQKNAVEDYLLDLARREGFPVTVLHPGHIVGVGWGPINPAGNLDLAVFSRLARGEGLALPNFGLEMLHHVHADDVAVGFIEAMRHWGSAVGESFHVVSPAALTLRGYAEAVADWFNQKADLRLLPWDQWRETVSEADAEATREHISHSLSCSIAKAGRLLEYVPRYTSLEAIRESVNWLIADGQIEV